MNNPAGLFVTLTLFMRMYVDIYIIYIYIYVSLFICNYSLNAFYEYYHNNIIT